MVDKELLDILACPVSDCHGEIKLDEEDQKLVCQKCGRKYPIRDGIPVMLADEAELPEEQESV